MDDPITSVNVPPPRYLLESDSEDEGGEDLYGQPGPSRPKTRVQPQPVDIQLEDSAKQCDQVIIGVGQAGRYLKRKLDLTGGGMSLTQGGEQLGHGFANGSTLVIYVNEVDNESVWDVASVLKEEISAKSWTVVTTYLPSMYIPDPTSPQLATPPIRYLSTHSDSPLRSTSAQLLSSPNFATGLPAALASLAIHPSSHNHPLTVISLPLPLSDIANADFSSVLTVLSTGLSDSMAQRKSDPGARWDERDDEPFSGLGMGARRIAPKHDLSKEEISSMYM